MIKYLKQFTSDSDRLTFEGSLNYERPYVSSVTGTVHYNKLIEKTLNNPSVGEINVEDGDYYDRITISKTIYVGGTNRLNFGCLPFNITVNELRQALGNHKLSKIGFASDMWVNIAVTSAGDVSYDSSNAFKVNFIKRNGTLVIPAGKPFVMLIDKGETSLNISVDLTFNNKTIVISSSLTGENIPSSNWYFVGSPFRIKPNATGLSTAVYGMGINAGALSRAKLANVTLAPTSGWLEYRGPVPSE